MGTLRGGCYVLGTVLLARFLATVADSSVECPPETGFTGGLTSLSNGLKEDSVAQFLCPLGKYPWPVSSRTCLPNGKWTTIKSSTGRKYNSVTCKDMRCPEPTSFENGNFSPRGPYLVGSNITFSCNDGYILRGSEERTCRRNAKWSGSMAVCDDGAGHCPDPGIPPGAIKTNIRYDIDEKVSYECSRGLTLMGSKERTCLESGGWSGSEVSCQYSYAFDLPEDVGRQFSGAFSGVLKTKQKTDGVGRTISIKEDGILNVYIVLDASKSIGKENFLIYENSARQIVDGLGRFDMKIQFGILSYASEVKTVMAIHDVGADESDTVLDAIDEKLNYAGKANMGGQPKDMVKKIKDFLDIGTEREEFLDIYAFGIDRELVDRAELNDIASNKPDEQHIFILEDAKSMPEIFARILDLKLVGDMCGLNEQSLGEGHKDLRYEHPWTAVIKTQTAEPCLGSLISKSWVLTAAHCFKAVPTLVEIGPTKFEVKSYKSHECYNHNRKASLGIKEDYDYDVGLIQLGNPVTFSKDIRTICIPCTEPANRAMKKSSASTCKDHREWLLTSNGIPAQYLAKDARYPNDRLQMKKNSVTIKINQARDACVAAVQTWDTYKNIDPSLLVSPRHLCVEGQMSCKGESGGPLFLDKKRRFFQVGILSFGLFNPCDAANQRKEPPRDPEARDFYVDVMKLLPWLRKNVDELEFLADVEAEEKIQCPA
uniref:Complement C2 n=1 Tax=Leptobrachium leishanense TaxID=445787 RepID=A0A8C5PF63_9ANUR